MLKRAICVILCVSMFILILMSCDKPVDPIQGETPTEANADDSPDSDSEAVQAQPEKPPLNVPDVKYNGYEFRVMNVAQSAMTWVYTNLYAEEENGDPINDAVYIRNRLVEERFDISIKEFSENSTDSIKSKVTKSIKAGSDDCDLFILEANNAAPLARDQMLVDYNDMPHVDLTQPWWDRDMVRDLSSGGRNYMVTGDFSMMHYGDTIGMFFNKKLLSELSLESPYNIINSGKWTFDKFSEMAKDASRDLNGDGAFTKDDQYGYMSLTHIWAQGFMASASQKPVVKDSNDMHSFVMNNEKFIQTYQRMIDIMHQGNMMFDADTAGDHRLQDIMFPNNQALFWSEVVHWATILREMDADFGIIIHPKLDENQSDYYNYVFPPPVMCVPITAPDIERTSMILEALCYESTDTVIKAYYEVLLKTKISRDDESEKMLDIMFQNRSYSLASIYYSNEIYNPFQTLSKKSTADVVSWIEKNENKILAAIEKNNTAFNEN